MRGHQPDILRLFEDILRNGTSLRVKVTGRSMSPFLRGEEIVTIKKVTGSSLHIGDLIFFKTRYSSPLLHRIIRKQYKDMVIFQTKGDAAVIPDEPVSEHDVLGKVYKIEKILSSGRTKHINMESRFRKTINYLLAIISSVQSRMYLAVAR
jgi:signal peptidase I